MASLRVCILTFLASIFYIDVSQVKATTQLYNTSSPSNGLRLPISLSMQQQPSSHSHKRKALPLSYMMSSLAKENTITTQAKEKIVFEYTSVALVTEMAVGNPPQIQKMVIDTGSELSWLSSSYNPAKSSTHRAVPCKSQICNERTRDFPVPTSCDERKLCHFTNSYADGTSVEGNLATDTFSSLTSSRNGLVFGFSASEMSDGTSGLMGLNKGSLSFISQLKSVAKVSRKFSICIPSIPSMKRKGNLYLGESPMSKYYHYTPLVSISLPLPYFDRSAYSIRVESIKVGKTLLPIPKSVFLPDHTGAGQTMIDSATHFTMLLGEAYTPLKQEFINQNMAVLGKPLKENFVYEGVLDLCYALNPNVVVAFQKLSPVTLMFESAQLSIQRKSLLFEVPEKYKGRKVLCFTFGNSDLLAVEANIIGNHHQQDLWVEYDLDKSRIGFAKAPC